MRHLILLNIILLMAGYCAHAGELNFETTEQGITSALIDSPQATSQTKKFKTRGLSSSSEKQSMRSIMVVKKEAGQIYKEKVMVPVDPKQAQGVNLKILFDTDSSSIRSESFPLLNELGKALTGQALQGVPVTIKGHTDADGEEAYNLNLSLERGYAVKRYLSQNFNLTGEIEVLGFGEAMPLVPNNSNRHKQINRRVEISARTY